jgi:thiosulfate/3-mercaptopyruvate sulfurtransferase
MDDLVSTAWLAQRLGESGLVILDASAHLPAAARDAGAEFVAAHIPGARFLDLASLTDPDSEVPAALPGASQFAERLQRLGIGPADRVVLYDDSAVKTSSRAWFIFRLHGFRQVAILDGGLGKWRAETRPLEGGVTRAARAERWHPGTGSVATRSKQDLLANLEHGGEQLLDARSGRRFRGEEPEAREGLSSGHIPGSLNLPYGAVLNADGTFKDSASLRHIFEEAGIPLDQPIVTTCGSGVTAAVLLFALHLIGKDDVALYDGSWSEWGADPATPKVSGALA